MFEILMVGIWRTTLGVRKARIMEHINPGGAAIGSTTELEKQDDPISYILNYGWEPFSVTRSENYGKDTFYFKRVRQNS